MPTIICIDDYRANLEVLRALLEHAGFRVFTCDDSRVGLQMALTEPIDLMVVDNTMPDLSGEEVAEALHRVKPRIPIIMCSGAQPPSQNCPINVFIPKGGDLRVVVTEAEKLLRRNPMSRLSQVFNDIRKRTVEWITDFRKKSESVAVLSPALAPTVEIPVAGFFTEDEITRVAGELERCHASFQRQGKIVAELRAEQAEFKRQFHEQAEFIGKQAEFIDRQTAMLTEFKIQASRQESRILLMDEENIENREIVSGLQRLLHQRLSLAPPSPAMEDPRNSDRERAS